MLNIVYAGNKYHNHDPLQGFSFDHTEFYGSLAAMPGVRVSYFLYDRKKEIGQARLNQELINLVHKEKPDLFLSIMYDPDYLTVATLLEIKKTTPTLGFFMDDHWHFHNSSRLAAPHLSWIATTYSKAVPLYRALGCKNIIRTHLGANTREFYPPEDQSENRFAYDVSFVGAWYVNRERVINTLRKAGVNVAVWGSGWPDGRLPDDRMLKTVHQTRINIDINPPSSHFGAKSLARFFLKRDNGTVKSDIPNFINNAREWWQKRTPMIKPRTFNCLAARSFVITQTTHDLHEFYDIGKEVAAFTSTNDLIHKIRYYLAHTDEREAIALAGYTKTLKDHTYEKRFREIFRSMGVRYP